MSEFKEVRCDHCGHTFAALSDGSPIAVCECGRTMRVSWTATDHGTIRTHTPPRPADDATVNIDPSFNIVSGTYDGGLITAFNDDLGTITSGRLWDGDLLATYRRAHAQVVATVAAGLRDAGLTNEATIDRLTAAIVERLGEGV